MKLFHALLIIVTIIITIHHASGKCVSRFVLALVQILFFSSECGSISSQALWFTFLSQRAPLILTAALLAIRVYQFNGE
jgi:hypothetical protein